MLRACSNLSIRFKQLFKYFNVRHAPMRCHCAQPVLRRQATKDSQPNGYVLNVEIPKAMNLDQGISLAMWEKLARRRFCPECDESPEPVHDFDKFAYLPEVLFMYTWFVDKSTGPDNYTSTKGEKLTYPERLDMSAFRDDPTRPGDQSDCTYKLQSIIHASLPAESQRIHEERYKAALRVNDIEFAQFEYVGAPDTFADFITFDQVNEASNGVPQLLIYVRERHPGAADNAPDAVKPKPSNPQGGTAEVATPTPSQPKPEVKPPTSRSHATTSETDKYDIQRFVEAQDQIPWNGITPYAYATNDLQTGRVTGTWIWCCFPMVPNVELNEDVASAVYNYDHGNRSLLVSQFTLNTLGEAKAFWNHPTLRDRYHELVQMVRNGEENDLDLLFGTEANAEHFFASVTLFFFLCRGDRENRQLFEDVFTRFDRSLQGDTLYQVARWFHKDGDQEGTYDALSYLKTHDEQDTTGHVQGGSSTGPTRTGPINPPSTDQGGNGTSPGTSTRHDSAQRIGSKLLSLAGTDFVHDWGEFDNEVASQRFERTCRKIGRLILGFGAPEGTAAPVSTPFSTPKGEEMAYRLGQHIMWLISDPKDPPPGNAPGTSALNGPASGFGVDGSSDDPGDGADLEYDVFNAVAIPSDPRDPRIAACEDWTLDELKREFQKEQLDWRGLRADPEKHRTKFRKHFQLDRDYSIYHEGRLRQAIEDRGIRLRHIVDKGDKIDKAELVDALTNYDAQILQEANRIGGGESDDTASVVYRPDPYESSEASDTEAKYVAMERAALAANGNAEATPVSPRVVWAAASAHKRPRDEDEDYEDDDDEEDDELAPRVPTKGPVRQRTRY